MWLTFASGDRSGERVEIEQRLVIGRAPDCDLVLDDTKVSRRHAEITRREDGGLQLRDLGSANGTYVDDARVREPVALSAGQRVRLGRSELEVGGTAGVPPTEIAGAAAAAAAGIEGPEEPAAREPAAAEEPAAEPPPEPVGRPSVVARTRSAIERIELRRATKRATAIAIGAVALAVIGVTVGALAVAGVFDGEDAPTAEEIVEGIAPATVFVSVLEDEEEIGGGTGWVLDAEEGLIVTNAHVIDAGDGFEVGVDGDLRDAEVVGSAQCDDIAMLRVDDTSGLETMPLGSQDDLAVGEDVIAVGFPTSLSEAEELTATRGVVSRNRDSSPEGRGFPNVVLTDTAISPGNSGGPLVDFDGRLVGVNTFSSLLPGVQNQNYAIGVDRVDELAADLREGRSLAWTGMGFNEEILPEDLAEQGFPPALVVGPVVPDTNAAEAGVEQGQLIDAVDGEPMFGSIREYCETAGDKESGDEIEFRFFTDGGTGTSEVLLTVE